MDVQLNSQLGNGYKSNSQKMRVITEAWAGDNVFCPYCGSRVSHFENNRPVADFYCSECLEEYELKSLRHHQNVWVKPWAMLPDIPTVIERQYLNIGA